MMFITRHEHESGAAAGPLAWARRALTPLSLGPRALLARRRAVPLIAFVHIPKTAGATVTSMFIDSYGAAEVRNAGNYLRHPERTPAKLARGRWTGAWTGARVVVGHIPYGLFRKNLPRDTRYVTFLREPVDRVLSHYHRHIERKSRTTDSLEEALEMRMPDISNLATRFLCGDRAPLGDLPSSALDDAKASLREFAFVGIQERFEESIVLLQRTLGLDLVPYVNAHVSIERPAVEEIPDAQRALIEESNALDVELYSFAQGLFQDAVATRGDDFVADVERLRALSAEANEEALRGAREWLDRELPAGAMKPKVALYSAAEADGVDRQALKHVIETTSVKKAKDRDGQRVLTRPEEARPVP